MRAPAESCRVTVAAVFFFQAEDGIRDLVRSRGLGDVYKRQLLPGIEILDYNELNHLDRINESTAAVIVEIIQAEAGIIIPSNEFLLKLAVQCKANGLSLIHI